MAPKKQEAAAEEPVVEERPPPPPRPQTPEVPLAPILEDLGWTRKKMLPSRRPFYWHEGRQLVQIGPPYYEVLGLDPADYETCTKSQIKAAWFKLKTTVRPIIDVDPIAKQNWALIMEAYEVLTDPMRRTEYEHENLSRTARQLKMGVFAWNRATTSAAEAAEADVLPVEELTAVEAS
jgi:hypothetical protein